MKQSRRALRMERHHKRNSRIPALNLISLMDIFTILVFFLLVNSSGGEVLPSTRHINLPESVADHRPRPNVVVMITDSAILVQGRAVVTLPEARNRADFINELKDALKEQSRQSLPPDDGTAQPLREVTIMGNKDIPYRLLKKVMASCTEAGYERISLAVLQKVAEQTTR